MLKTVKMLPPPCKSCRKAADSGKKKSTIESSQKTGSVLFDGADPNLPAKDFAPDSSNPAALTGGLLLDLKANEPDLSKVGPLTDFSLDKPTTLVFAKYPRLNKMLQMQERFYSALKSRGQRLKRNAVTLRGSPAPGLKISGIKY
ncbi:MAG: hypothetical protein HY796_00525 [Elusimicrobia bacterium]|nr:hypothetical protein [Elusimicrobiota bacterium]